MNEEECIHCEEAKLNVGEKTDYGSVIIYKNGEEKNGWYATLSPKTGGDIDKDFSIQLMPRLHLKHMSDIGSDLEIAKNYGIAFSQLSKAATILMKEEERDKENDENVVRIGTYGKSKHHKEHFHVKLFPWSGNIGQPYTVDTSFEYKEVHEDINTGKEFVKMKPVKKVEISKERIDYLAKRFRELLIS